MNIGETFRKEVLKHVGPVTPSREKEVRAKFKMAEKAARARGAAEGFLRNVRLLWRMIVDPDYIVSWQVKSQIVFALAYFIAPADVIPDVLVGVGYLDDALVVGWVMHKIAEELDAYKRAHGIDS